MPDRNGEYSTVEEQKQFGAKCDRLIATLQILKKSVGGQDANLAHKLANCIKSIPTPAQRERMISTLDTRYQLIVDSVKDILSNDSNGQWPANPGEWYRHNMSELRKYNPAACAQLQSVISANDAGRQKDYSNSTSHGLPAIAMNKEADKGLC